MKGFLSTTAAKPGDSVSPSTRSTVDLPDVRLDMAVTPTPSPVPKARPGLGLQRIARLVQNKGQNGAAEPARPPEPAATVAQQANGASSSVKPATPPTVRPPIRVTTSPSPPPIAAAHAPSPGRLEVTARGDKPLASSAETSTDSGGADLSGGRCNGRLQRGRRVEGEGEGNREGWLLDTPVPATACLTGRALAKDSSLAKQSSLPSPACLRGVQRCHTPKSGWI
jgi:hypothetical protein